VAFLLSRCYSNYGGTALFGKRLGMPVKPIVSFRFTLFHFVSRKAVFDGFFILYISFRFALFHSVSRQFYFFHFVCHLCILFTINHKNSTIMKKQKTTSKPKVKEPISLRQKPLKNGGYSLYLDCYVNGNRWYEFLKLYLVPNNVANAKQRNDETLSLAASIQGKRIAELQNDAHGFSNSKIRSKTNLLTYIEQNVKKRQERAIANGRKKSSGSASFNCLIYHLKQYKGEKTTFQQVDKMFCLGFVEYLRSAKSTTKIQFFFESTKPNL
jgi:hypothetical protein